MPRKSPDWTPDDLRGWRTRLALTVSQAADALRLHPHSLKNLLNGRRPVSDAVRARAVRIERRATEPPKPKAAATPVPVLSTASEVDEAAISAAGRYAVAVSRLVDAVATGTVTREVLADVDAAGDRLDALLDTGGQSSAASQHITAVVLGANAARKALTVVAREREARAAETKRSDGEHRVSVAIDGWNGDVTGPQTMTVSALGGTGGWDLRSVPLVMTGDLEQAGVDEDYQEKAKDVPGAAHIRRANKLQDEVEKLRREVERLKKRKS